MTAGRERWDRSRLRSRLRPDSATLREAERALAARDWPAAENFLRSHFLHRPRRFVLAPADRPGLAPRIRERYPSAQRDAALRGNELLQGRYDLLGYQGLSFRTGASDIDWHLDPVHGRRAAPGFWSRVPYLDPQSGDHKIIWEINRHQHWLALGRAAWLTGDERYAARFSHELDSWLRANPPLIGINWSSMLELAFRSLSWVWALHLFAGFGDGEPTSIDLLLGLDRQLNHVAQHLSTYFSPNTHLLGEGLALYVAGRSLPELTGSARWEPAGRGILLREARAQVHADGGHAELSTHYHRYALDFYLLALVIARRTNDPAADAFADVTWRLARFCRTMADDRGRLPTIGDDDGGMLFPMCGRAPFDASDSLALAGALLDRPELAVSSLPEEALWMLGADAPLDEAERGGVRPPQTSTLFPDTGYAVLRSPDTHAIVDVGPHGFLNAGHAHADALSVVMSVGGRSLLIDPGTSTYTMDRERRDRFRSTVMHNTLVIDGADQSRPEGPFHWATRARGHVDCWSAEGGFIEASHDGYLPLVHRRAVLRGPNGLWLVADHVLGTGRHQAAVHWHLSPEWNLEQGHGPHAAVRHNDGTMAALASTSSTWRAFRGDAQGLGWCAPVYGQLEPATTLRFPITAEAPFSVITAIACGAAAAGLAVQEVRVTPADANEWHSSAAIVTSCGATAIVLFATRLVPQDARHDRKVRSVATPEGRFSTDARAAVLQFSPDGNLDALIAIDCCVVEWTGDGAFRTAPQSEERDLHLDVGALRRLSHLAAARPVG